MYNDDGSISDFSDGNRRPLCSSFLPPWVAVPMMRQPTRPPSVEHGLNNCRLLPVISVGHIKCGALLRSIHIYNVCQSNNEVSDESHRDRIIMRCSYLLRAEPEGESVAEVEGSVQCAVA